MKQKIIVHFAAIGAALLLMGAVAVETVNQLYIEPHTVSSWGELVDCYLAARTTLPPLPFAYDDALIRIQTGDWSFLADHWQYKQTDGTYYVAEKSKLAELKLPLHILVYEDLKRGEIVVLSSTDGTNFQGEVAFKAPEFMTYEKDIPLDRYAFDELAPRRIIWEITLKPEAYEWIDLVPKQSTLTASSLSTSGGGMITMSTPAASTNQPWLTMNGQNLILYVPSGFTNRMEIYGSDDLVSNVWNIAVQNLTPVSTNPAVWSPSLTEIKKYYRPGNMDIDSDDDGINDDREKRVHKTDPNLTDSDDDTISDYQELYVDFTDPNNDDTSPPVVSLVAPGSSERKAVLP